MGSGLSNLNAEQKIMFVQCVRVKYEDFMIMGMELTELQDRITEQCNQIIEKIFSGSLDFGKEYPGIVLTDSKNEKKMINSFDEQEDMKIRLMAMIKTGITEDEETKTSLVTLNSSPSSPIQRLSVSEQKESTIPGYALPTNTVINNQNTISSLSKPRPSSGRAGSRPSSSTGKRDKALSPTIIQNKPITKATRRKSFDFSNRKNLVSRGKIPGGSIKSSQGTEVLVNEIVSEVTEGDCWDSVTTQPFCNLCKMAFRTEFILERHINFSQLHSSKLKEIELAKSIEEMKIRLEEEKLKEENEESMIEGIHFYLLYIGTKFYWRPQKSIDYRIYLHVSNGIVEVIGFDPNQGKEYNRVYLESKIIDSIIASRVTEDVETTRKNIAMDRFAILPSDDELRDKIHRNVFATYIVQRLQFSAESTETDLKSEVSFGQLAGDDPMVNPILKTIPQQGFQPINIAQRRHSSVQEMNDGLNELIRQRAAIAQSTADAQTFSLTSELNINLAKY